MYEKEGRSKSYISSLLDINRRALVAKINEWELVKGEKKHLSPSTKKFFNKHADEIADMLNSDMFISDIAKKIGVNRTSLLRTYIYGDKKLLHCYNLYKQRQKSKKNDRINGLISRSSRIYADDLDGEIWRDILGYENYQVSNYGRIRKLAKAYGKYYLIRSQKNHLSQREYVTLTKNGMHKNLSLPRIVAHTFVDGFSDENNTVDHIDGDVLNNKASNLAWVSQSINNSNAYKNGRNKSIAYSKSGRFKKIIMDKKYEFKTIKALSKFLKVSETQASRYIFGESKTDHTFQFVY